MPDYRRYRVPGGIYFFTINLLERRSDPLVRHIDALRDAVRRTGRSGGQGRSVGQVFR
jgi:putative transposase